MAHPIFADTNQKQVQIPLVCGEWDGLGVVVAEVGDLNGTRHDGNHLVAVIDDVSSTCEEYVVAADEERPEGFVEALRVAEILQVDSGRSRHLRNAGVKSFALGLAGAIGFGIGTGAESAENMLRPLPA